MSADDLARRAAAAMLARDRASQGLGMVIEEVRAGYARLRMTVRPDMLNGHASCHGGFIFALANSAFAFACNSRNRATVAAGCRHRVSGTRGRGGGPGGRGPGAGPGRPARGLRHHRAPRRRDARGAVPRPLLRPQGQRDRGAAAAMRHAFICDAIRTPIGRYGGSLSAVRADDLACAADKGAAARATRRSTGPPSTTSSWLRQPGRRGQPQRRAHGRPAGRPAGRGPGHHHQPPVRLRHGRHSARPPAPSAPARPSW